jgi:GT2 family glycosyltransferase
VPLVVTAPPYDLEQPLDEIQHAATAAAILDEFLAAAARPLKLLEVRHPKSISLSPFLDAHQAIIVSGRIRPDGRLELPAGDAEVFDDRGDIVDGAFDAVVGLDLLNRIDAEHRTAALRECLRISKHGVVVTAVNRVPSVNSIAELDPAGREQPHAKPFADPTPSEIHDTLRSASEHVVEFDCVRAELWFALRSLDAALSSHESCPELRRRVIDSQREVVQTADGVPFRKAFVCGSSSRAAAHLRSHPLVSPTVRAFHDDSETVASALRCANDIAARTLSNLQRDVQCLREQAGSQLSQIHAQAAELAAIRQAWSWKLAVPMRWLETWAKRAAERLVQVFWRTIWSIFPIRYTLAQMRPAHEIDGIPETGTWIALGHDPQFHVPTPRIAGWMQITLRMRSDTAGRVMLYHDDTGNEFNGDDVWTIGSLRADQWLEVRKVIWHGKPIHALRFDPVDAPAKLTIEQFEIACVPGWLRIVRGLRSRIAAAHARGVLGSMLRNAIGLALRGDFAAIRRKLSDRMPGGPGAAPDSQYELWRELRKLRLPSVPAAASGDDCAAELPRLSILLAPGDASPAAVKRSLDSILRQSSSRWELCIACDRTTPDRVRSMLTLQSRFDRRVRIADGAVGHSRTNALNDALAIATGDFVASLTPGDELADHALADIAKACAAIVDIDLVYADEDRVNEYGRHSDPFFKPDWSPEYLLATNYIGPTAFVRAKVIREVAGFREDFGEAADYDLALRCLARGVRVLHVADVLVHRGASSQRDSARVADAERAALRAHLQATGQVATVEPGLAPNTHRVRSASGENPLVSIIIPSACGQTTIDGESTWFLLKCVQSIRERSTYQRVEILVVDNNDMPAELERALRPYDVRVVHFTEPFNLSAKMNLGAARAEGEHLVFMNDDIEVSSPDWIQSLLDFSVRDGVGAVGARLLFPNGCLQHVGVTILDGNPGHPFYLSPGSCAGYFHSTRVHRNYVAVTGACVMTPARVFRELGGFDVRFPLNYNDVDYCLRVVESGRRNVFTPYAELYHHESVSKSGTTLDELANFKRKWLTRYRVDPYYNPNLTVTRSDYSLCTMDAA